MASLTVADVLLALEGLDPTTPVLVAGGSAATLERHEAGGVAYLVVVPAQDGAGEPEE